MTVSSASLRRAMRSNAQLKPEGAADRVVEEYEHAEHCNQQILKVEPSVDFGFEPIELCIESGHDFPIANEAGIRTSRYLFEVPIHARGQALEASTAVNCSP